MKYTLSFMVIKSKVLIFQIAFGKKLDCAFYNQLYTKADWAGRWKIHIHRLILIELSYLHFYVDV